VKMAENGDIEWRASHAKLLEDLMAWRTKVTAKEECLEGMVCSLDLLVSIAAKRPSSEMALRRIQYHLPELLEEKEHRDEMLSIVMASIALDGLPPSEIVPSYCSQQQQETETVQARETDKETETETAQETETKPFVLNWNPWYTVASATASMVVATIVILRRLRR
jgi:HRDC domain